VAGVPRRMCVTLDALADATRRTLPGAADNRAS
jgi:hypothetical protein